MKILIECEKCGKRHHQDTEETLLCTCGAVTMPTLSEDNLVSITER